MKPSVISLVATGALTLATATVGWGQSGDTPAVQAQSAADQQKTQSSETDSDTGKLEEVLVTAQRRVERLQDVPVSVQVIGGQALADENQNSLSDLAETVPALHISNVNVSNALSMRGIGSGENPTYDQSVAMFSDDIYNGRSRMSAATFLDLDRIEVLKGPQSTFFGNNAIAGALNIVSNKPGDSFDASARLLYGQYGQYAVEGVIGGPIADGFGVRLAVTRNGGTGWIDNIYTGENTPDVNNEAARMTLAYRPNEDFDVTLKFEGSQNRLEGTSFGEPQQSTCPPPAPITPSFGGPFLNCVVQLSTPGFPLGLDQHKMSTLPGSGNFLSTFENVLTANYRMWGDTFTSVTGFYNYNFNSNISTFVPVDVYTIQVPERYNQFSQEFRVASPTGESIEYLAGAYFQTDRINYATQLTAPTFNSLIPILFPDLASYLPLADKSAFSQREDIYSIFGSLSWNITRDLKLTGGLRGTLVAKDFAGSFTYGTGTELYGGFVPLPPALVPAGGILLGAPGAQNLSTTNRALMPSLGIQYQINPEAMGYFHYSRGFLAGGFNGLDPVDTAANISFRPEYVTAFELGIKSTWLDDTVLLNLDVFRSNYSDLQVEAFTYNSDTNLYIERVENAASSVSQGVELETQWAITKGFRVGANITALDSHYVKFSGAAPSTLQSYCASLGAAAYAATPQCAVFPTPILPFASLSGRPTENAPHWSGNITASYSILLPAGLKLSAEVDPYFTSSYYPIDSNDDPLFRIGGSMRLDGRLSLETSNHRWGVDIIGKNLANRVIPTFLGPWRGTAEEPRNIAAQFRFKY